MSQELIPITTHQANGETIQAVDARVLYDRLKVKTKFATWIERRITEGMFIIGQDLFPKMGNGSYLTEQGKQKINYILTIDCAKHIALMEKTKIGKKVRQSLIDFEKNVIAQIQEGNLVQKPLSQIDIIYESAKVLKSHEERLLKLEQKQTQAENQLLALPESDREPKGKTLRAMINERVRAFARITGKRYPDIWNKLYKEMYYRCGVNVKLKAKNRGMDTLDYIEQEGLMEVLFDIACVVLKIK